MKNSGDGKTGGGLGTPAKILLGIGAVLLVGIISGLIHERTVPDPTKAPDELSEDPRLGDVLIFYRPRRGRDYFIRWITRSPFYHTALYAGANTVIEARPAGVHRNSLAGRENSYLVIPAPENRGAAALEWAKTQIGDPYDAMDGIVAALEHIFTHWHINYTFPGKYSCAELVTAAYEHAGFKPFPDKEYTDVVPADWAEYLPEPYAAKFSTT